MYIITPPGFTVGLAHLFTTMIAVGEFSRIVVAESLAQDVTPMVLLYAALTRLILTYGGAVSDMLTNITPDDPAARLPNCQTLSPDVGIGLAFTKA